MTRRVAMASTVGGVAAVLLGLLAVLMPTRPTGTAGGMAFLALLIPAVAGAATAIAIRGIGQDDARRAAGLAAVSSPILVVLGLFAADLALPFLGPAAHQLTALVGGVGGAAGLAARFTGPDARDDGAPVQSDRD